MADSPDAATATEVIMHWDNVYQLQMYITCRSISLVCLHARRLSYWHVSMQVRLQHTFI